MSLRAPRGSALAAWCLAALLLVSAPGAAAGTTLSSSANPARVGTQFTVTYTDPDYGDDDYYGGVANRILDNDNGGRVLNLCQNPVCTYREWVPWTSNANPPTRHFSADTTSSANTAEYAPGHPTLLTVETVPVNLQLDLTTDKDPVPAGEAYHVRASVSVDLDQTGLALEILDADHGDHIENTCTAQTCQLTKYAATGEGFRHFKARVVILSTEELIDGDVRLSVEIDDPPAASDSFGCICHILGSTIEKLLMADPVNGLTGNLAEEATDLATGGLGLGLPLTRTYNSLAAVSGATSAKGPFGWGWTSTWREHITFDEHEWGDTIATVHNGDGSTTPFKFRNGSTYRLKWIQSRLTHSGGGGYTYTLPDQTKMHFSSSGRLQSAEDENGNTTTLDYDSGNLVAVTDPAGRSLTFTYNGDGTVDTATDPAGNTVEYGYTAGELTSVTDAAGKTTHYGYSGRKLTTITDARGHTVTNYYDSDYRVTAQQDRAGNWASWDYYDGMTIFVDAAGTRWRFLSTYGVPTSVTRGYFQSPSETQTFAYDSSLRPSAVTDARGHAWTYGYNAAGDVTSVTDPLSRVTTSTYDAEHHLTSVTKPSGQEYEFEYDGDGNLTSTTTKAETSTVLEWTNEYDGRGLPTSSTDPLEHTWTFDHNAHGDLISATSPLGHETTYGYDDDGQLVSTVSARGNEPGATASQFTTAIERDPVGLVSSVTDPLGHETSYAYDDNHNLVDVTDADGRVTHITRDNQDRPTSVTRGYGTADATTESTSYTALGWIAEQVDGLGQATTYEYDRHGRATSMTDPLDRQTHYSYDLSGNLTGVTDEAGRTQTLAYDDANQLTSASYSTGTPAATTYTYTPDGRLHTAARGGKTTTLSYDSLGRLVSSTDRAGQETGYHWDHAGRLTALDYPDVLLPLDTSGPDTQDTQPAGTVEYEYDDDDRMTSVTDWLETTTDFGYDAEGHLKSIERPGVDPTSYDYDRNGSMVAMSEPGIDAGDPTLTTSYTRTDSGQLSGENAKAYAYDETARLAGVDAASYGYDDGDNLTTTLVPNGSTAVAQVFDDAHQLTRATPSGGTATDFDYDDLGNRITATLSGAGSPTASYDYDQANRLIGYDGVDHANPSGPDVTESYSYDPLGQRATKLTGDILTHETYDLTAGLPLMIEDAGTAYIHGPAGPLEHIDSDGHQSFYTQDQLGSTTRLTDVAGRTQATYAYSAYGNATATIGGHSYTDGSGTHTIPGADTPFRFAGEYTDSHTGLQYLRARYYDPATGQFLTRDPIEALTRQPYSYAENDPANATDPTGLFARDPLDTGGRSPAGPGNIKIPNPFNALKGIAKSIKEHLVGRAVTSGLSSENLSPVTLDTTDCVGGFPGAAARAGGGALRGVDDVLEGLPVGRQPHVRTVGSQDELQTVYDDLAHGAEPVDVPGYPGKWVERPDGTRVGVREGSKSGGATIDIRRPDGSIQKVHVR